MFRFKKYFGKVYWFFITCLFVLITVFIIKDYYFDDSHKNIDLVANAITNKLSDEELIGQLLFIFLPDSNKYPLASNIILDLLPGGIFIQKNSFETNELKQQNIKELTDRIRRINKQFISNKNIIPFWGTDQEYGKVQRFYTNVENFPSAMTVGQAVVNTGDYSLASSVAFHECNDLKKIGFTWLFSPVADIQYNSYNPIIGTRSFGFEAQEVAKILVAFTQGLHLAGCADTLKHFPGHGSVSTDSHLEIPVIHKKLSTLEKEDLLPFRNLIQSNISNSIMVGHLKTPKIDKTTIATFSPFWLRKKIRDEWNYHGIIITDDIGMKAASPTFSEASISKAALLSLKAGTDIVLMSEGSHVFAKQVKEAILLALKNKEIKRSQVWNSVKRVIKLKIELGLLDAKSMQDYLSPNQATLVQKIDDFQKNKILIKEKYQQKILSPKEINKQISLLGISLLYGDELACTHTSFIGSDFYTDSLDTIEYRKGNGAYSISSLSSYNRQKQQVILYTEEQMLDGSFKSILQDYLIQKDRKSALIYSVHDIFPKGSFFSFLRKGDCLISSFSKTSNSKHYFKEAFLNKERVRKINGLY